MYFLLFYDVVDNYVDRRAPYRPAHLAMAQEFVRNGDLLLAGALSSPADGAVLVFRTAEAAERFVATDPYVSNGLITDWRIREWTVVAGTLYDPGLPE